MCIIDLISEFSIGNIVGNIMIVVGVGYSSYYYIVVNNIYSWSRCWFLG